MDCIAEMRVPTYRGVIWYAGFVGTVNVKASLGSDAHAISVDVKGSNAALAGLVKSAFATAKFSATCAGASFTMNFVYRIAGDKSKEPDNEVVWREPDTFEITARPPVPLESNP